MAYYEYLRNDTLEERFLRYVEKTANCWLWIGSKSHGYGWMRYKNIKPRPKAHRISYELYNGKIPKGISVLHKCDNCSCVNPKHLFLGTQKDNIKDMVKKKRHRQGESKPNSKLTWAEVQYIRAIPRTITHQKIADCFGVCRTLITDIINKKRWVDNREE